MLKISFDIVNDGGLVLANSSDVDSFDRFNITVDQLEGEITVPYQFVNKINTGSAEPFVERRILVPNTLLGGFTQFRINYTFIEFPEAGSMAEGENVGTFFSDSFVKSLKSTKRTTVSCSLPVRARALLTVSSVFSGFNSGCTEILLVGLN